MIFYPAPIHQIKLIMAQTRSSAKHKKKSLCEKSMLLVANIIKLSSLCLVTMSFGTTPKDVEKKRGPSSAKVPDHQTEDVSALQRSRSRRSQEPEGASKSRSYLMEPQKGSPSYVTSEKKDINDRAADFIRRTRQKIKKSDLNSASKCLSRNSPNSAPHVVREISLHS